MKKYLKGKTVLVTAGPTREPIDSVRYISNRSSGKMGYCLAEAAKNMGARVILVSGPTHLQGPVNTKIIKVGATSEMLRAILKYIKKADMLIMAGAPSDFTPFEISSCASAGLRFQRGRAHGKIKRSNKLLLIKLKPTPDILKVVSRKKNLKKGLIKVGFAAEAGPSISRAYQKLKDKGLDAIVANDISRKDIGFDSDFNEVYIIKKNKAIIKTKRLNKKKLAKKIILHLLDKRPLRW